MEIVYDKKHTQYNYESFGNLPGGTVLYINFVLISLLSGHRRYVTLIKIVMKTKKLQFLPLKKAEMTFCVLKSTCTCIFIFNARDVKCQFSKQ